MRKLTAVDSKRTAVSSKNTAVRLELMGISFWVKGKNEGGRSPATHYLLYHNELTTR